MSVVTAPIRTTSLPDRAESFSVDRVLDSQLRMPTPENIAFQYQLSGPFQRVLAYGLDLLITQIGYWGLVMAIGLLLMFFGTIAAGATGVAFFVGLFSAMVFIGAFLVTWFYGAIMETHFNGQTLGKRALGIRVISADGSAIDGRQATLRNFFRLVDLAPFAPLPLLLGDSSGTFAVSLPTFMFGLLAMTINARFRRIGDLIAGTTVVLEAVPFRQDLTRFDDPRVAELAKLVPRDFLITQSLSSALAEYVEGRRFLGQARSNEIARHLTPKLLAIFGLPGSTDPDLLLCALYYRAFYTLDESDAAEFDVLTMGRASDGESSQRSVSSQDESDFEILDALPLEQEKQ